MLYDVIQEFEGFKVESLNYYLIICPNHKLFMQLHIDHTTEFLWTGRLTKIVII